MGSLELSKPTIPWSRMEKTRWKNYDHSLAFPCPGQSMHACFVLALCAGWRHSAEDRKRITERVYSDTFQVIIVLVPLPSPLSPRSFTSAERLFYSSKANPRNLAASFAYSHHNSSPSNCLRSRIDRCSSTSFDKIAWATEGLDFLLWRANRTDGIQLESHRHVRRHIFRRGV